MWKGRIKQKLCTKWVNLPWWKKVATSAQVEVTFACPKTSLACSSCFYEAEEERLKTTISGVVENLVADIIFIMLAFIVSGIWVTLTYRRKLQQFFHTLKR